jgi:exodeoxyribonuclease V alpha subunit
MQTANNYEKQTFNGDLGRIDQLDEVEQQLTVAFDDRSVVYDLGELDELVPAYATTIHKSQGSEYPAVVLPLHTQHYPLLQRSLLYTGLTRSRRLVVLVGTKKAIGLAVKSRPAQRRVTLLRERLGLE